MHCFRTHRIPTRSESRITRAMSVTKSTTSASSSAAWVMTTNFSGPLHTHGEKATVRQFSSRRAQYSRKYGEENGRTGRRGSRDCRPTPAGLVHPSTHPCEPHSSCVTLETLRTPAKWGSSTEIPDAMPNKRLDRGKPREQSRQLTFVPVNRFNSSDLPAFGSPSNATRKLRGSCTSSGGVNWRNRASGGTSPSNDSWDRNRRHLAWDTKGRKRRHIGCKCDDLLDWQNGGSPPKSNPN